MTLIELMDKKLEKQMKPLPEKDKVFIRKIKNKFTKSYETIKPFLIAVGMFYIFAKLKKAIGIEETVFILLVFIVILLRQFISKFD